ncbi:hypothetical protein Hte_005268 [Hypoxylon texense]
MLFPDFSTETRLMIWEEALREEASNRIVFLDTRTGRVIPTKHLASPLLSVNKESRQCALRFFGMKLTVERLKEPIGFDTHNDYDPVSDTGFKQSVDEVLPLYIYNDRNYGALYLSPRYDIFCTSFQINALKTRFHEDQDRLDWCLEWALTDFAYPDPDQIEWAEFGTFPKWVTTMAWEYTEQLERVLSLRILTPFSYYGNPKYRTWECFEEETQYSWGKDLVSYKTIQQYLFLVNGEDWEDSWVEPWVHYLVRRRPGEPLPVAYSVANMRELPWVWRQQDGEYRKVLDHSRYERQLCWESD